MNNYENGKKGLIQKPPKNSCNQETNTSTIPDLTMEQLVVQGLFVAHTEIC